MLTDHHREARRTAIVRLLRHSLCAASRSSCAC